ncbi:MAG TPA: hypothetical protein VFQ58_04580 [Flavisolibacter sp.]|jgi:hypothetical protein|nr:hypothetical protein [Flavisolibacter sp.]
MRSLLLLSFLFLQFFYSCKGNNDEQKAAPSENDVDAARNFIRSALDGDYSKARTYMLKDSSNTDLLDAYENIYQHRMSKEDKRGYREATINMNEVRPVNDSITVVNYSNSFKKKKDSLKIVKLKGQWLVDFKYSFQSKEPLKK